MQPGKRSTTSRWKRLSCPSASFLILVFSIAVIVASLAVLLLIDVATPPLSNVFLSRKQFPQGQHLRIKSRRVTKIGASCDGFGVRRELFFHKFGGLQCALISWQSADEYEEEDRYIAKVETVYKVFGDNASAGEYFTKFWGTHMYDPLPPYLYVRKGAEAPRAGQQQRAFRWDSTNVRPGMPVPLQAVSTPPHVIFLFQEGRFFVRLLIQAFPNGRDERMGVETAGRLAGIISYLIDRNEPSERRKLFIELQSEGRRIVYGGMKSVSITIRSAWKIVRKWGLMKLVQLYDKMSSKEFGVSMSVQDAQLLLIALLVLLHNRFNAFVKPYSQMAVSHLKLLAIIAAAIDRSRQNRLTFTNG